MKLKYIGDMKRLEEFGFKKRFCQNTGKLLSYNLNKNIKESRVFVQIDCTDNILQLAYGIYCSVDDTAIIDFYASLIFEFTKSHCLEKVEDNND